MEGETYAGSPEIFLAREMGAKIVIEHGVIVPWKNNVRPFEVFTKSIADPCPNVRFRG